jgi:fermentation-respiration switch protein FrsA (DUF1100 family)
MPDRPKLHLNVLSETTVVGGRRLVLEFRARGDAIPGIMQIPDRVPAPAALLLHGYSSRKEVMADAIGSALLARGIASLAIDLPMHGGRRAAAAANALELIKHWSTAQTEARLAIRFLGAHKAIDGDRIALVGYSLGSFLSLAIAPEESCVRAVVLAAGGDLPENIPFAAFARSVIDPRRLVRRLTGRPLLMVHGKRDRTVTPQQAMRLFEAAEEPKEIRWYDAGHVLPGAAAADAANWLAGHIGDLYISGKGAANS